MEINHGFSFLCYVENERSKLDPLPEEKPATTTSTAATTISTPSTEPYKRVYPDWKPSTTLEKTDIAGNIEAIEDAQSRSKDKSAWRKSNLNVPNSSEETEYNNRVSRSKIREPAAISSSLNAPLQSIIEEDRRKNQHSDRQQTNDPLKSYTRRASEAQEYEPVYQKHDSKSHVGITSDQHSIYIRPSTSSPKSPTNKHYSNLHVEPQKDDESVSYNRIEIDSDNIETPPATRRNIVTDNKVSSRKLQTPRPLHRRTLEDSLDETVKPKTDIQTPTGSLEKSNESYPLGDGQFDRYSSARRTRRYRRPTDHSSGNEERTDTSPDAPSPSDTIYPMIKSVSNSGIIDSNTSSESNDTKTIQSPIANSVCETNKDSVNEIKSANLILSRVGKVGRNISSINQEAVREAIRNLKSPTETPERIWSPPREIVTKDKILPVKVANHELNDEGFEETQSLVSDTPSHGKESTSSCNDQIDQKAEVRSNVLRMTSTDSTATAASAELPSSKRRIVPKSSVQNLLERNRQSLERSRSLRASNTTPSIRNVIPKRTNSLRKSESNNLQHKRDVERSSSRTSLRSSRSSLNSSASTNTVRNMALKTTRTPPQPEKSSHKKPLNIHNNTPSSKTSHTKSTTSRTPASRSSSSGSSIGPSPRKSNTRNSSSSNSVTPTSVPLVAATNAFSNNFKENQSAKPNRPAFRNTVSNSSHSNSSLASNVSATVGMRNSPSSRLTNLTKGLASKTSNRVSNFMRPTTSSVTKRSTSAGKGK